MTEHFNKRLLNKYFENDLLKANENSVLEWIIKLYDTQELDIVMKKQWDDIILDKAFNPIKLEDTFNIIYKNILKDNKQ